MLISQASSSKLICLYLYRVGQDTCHIHKETNMSHVIAYAQKCYLKIYEV